MNMRVFTLALLAGASLVAMDVSAYAQAAANNGKPLTAAQKRAAAAKARQTQAAAPAAEPAKPTRDRRSQAGLTSAPTDFGRVDISGDGVSAPTGLGVTRNDLGGGYILPEEATKTRSTVTRDAIAKQSPTANPYQLIDLLPGVVQSSNSNTGLNGGDITLRGFNSNQIGLTIEGAPVNDSGNYALYPAEYLDAENIGQISIAQGSPDLDSPHIGATGGVINIYARDPSEKAGGLVDFSYGSNSASREFVRVESGKIGEFRGFASFSHYQENHWTGPGHDNRNHADFKGVWDPANGNRIALSLIYNWADNDFYRNPSKAEFANPALSNTGLASGYLPSLPASYFTPPAGSPPAAWDKTLNNASSYYEYKTNPFRNLIASLPSTFAINSSLTFDTVPYFWYGYGNGGGTASVAETLPGSVGSGFYYGTTKINGVDWNGNGVVTKGDKALLYNPSITETYRPGIINKLTYTMGEHKFVAGYWFEFASHKQTAPYAFLDANGKIVDPFLTSGAISIPGIGTLERRDMLTKTVTNTVFAGDTWSALSNLDIEFGTKVSNVHRDVYNYLPGVNPQVSSNDTVVLPTIGFRYKVTGEHQIFGSVNTSFKSTPNFALADSVSNSTGVITPANPLKPERGVSLEVGHRYQSAMLATSLSFYYTHYENHQISTNAFLGVGTNAQSTTINAGAADLYGAAFEIGTARLWDAWRPYASINLEKTRIGSNLRNDVANPAGGGLPAVIDYLPTLGKQLPNTPQFTLATGLDYDDGHIFGNLTAKYVGSQYSTLVNDEQISGYTRVNASIGYRFDDIGFAKKPELKLQLFNIFNQKALTSTSSITSNALATPGLTTGATIAGSTPFYYVGQGFSALATFTAAF